MKIKNDQFKFVKSFVAPVGVISTVGGFFSDVLQPLAPVSKYLFLIGLPLGLVILFLIAKVFVTQASQARKHTQTAGLAIVIFSLMNGAMWGLQTTTASSDKGFFGSNFEWVGSLQADLGAVRDDVSEIKDTTNLIAETTSNIEKQGSRIETKLESIAESFSVLSKSGGLVQSPSTAAEFLFNAKKYQEQGNFQASRTAFINYFKFDEVAIDPAISFSELLVATEGRAGAAESLREVLQSTPSLPLQIVLAGLNSPDSAEKILKELLKENPDYGPIYYQLARQYSFVRRGEDTLSFQLKEREYLQDFIEAYDQGKVLKYFIDKKMASSWFQQAETRINETRNVEQLSDQNAVSFNFVPSGRGDFIAHVSTPEVANKILYKVSPDSKELIEADRSPVDFTSGGVKLAHILIDQSKAASLQVFYLDTSGQEKGPFSPSQDEYQKGLDIIKKYWPD